MSDPVRLTFDRPPSLGSGYRRAFLDGLLRRKRGPTAEHPQEPLEARCSDLRIDPEQVQAYRRVCGFAEGTEVPVTFPHILAAPLHLAMLNHPRCRHPAAGIIPARNLLRQFRPLAAGQSLEITVRLSGHRDVRNGYEADVLTEAGWNGETLWESVTTVFVRRKSPQSREESPAKPPASPSPEPAVRQSLDLSLPPDQGRRYAAVSGDYNPIHLYPWSARLLGFPRPIIHGMWSLARCVAAMPKPPLPQALEVEFRRPILLPGKVRLEEGETGGGSFFRMVHPETGKAYLVGRFVRIEG